MRVVVHAPPAARVDVAVDLRRREGRVPEQLLDRPQVGAAFEEMGGICMSEAVRVRQQTADDARVEPPPAHRDEQCVAGAADELRAPVAEPESDPPGGLLAERDEPLLSALPAHVEVLAVEVDVSEVERVRNPWRLGPLAAGGSRGEPRQLT